jgi:hypothetical protein
LLAGIRSRLTYANVVASLALFIALGGVAWAAATINSTDVVDNSLRSVDLKDGKGVRGADVAPDTLGGAAVDESSFAEVPSAADADTLDGTDSDGFVAPGSEAWKPLPLHGPPGSFFCHWENTGGDPASYFRDPAGMVHLKGLVKAVDGTGDVCDGNLVSERRITDFGALPAGYRPPNAQFYPIVSNNAPGMIVNYENHEGFYISQDYPSWANAKQWVSLHGLSWRCEPSGQDGCP